MYESNNWEQFTKQIKKVNLFLYNHTQSRKDLLVLRSEMMLAYVLWNIDKNLFNDLKDLIDFVCKSSADFDYELLSLFDFKLNKPKEKAKEKLWLFLAEEKI